MIFDSSTVAFAFVTNVPPAVLKVDVAPATAASASARSFFAKGYSSPADVFATLGRTVGSVNVPDKGEAFPGLPGLIARDFSIVPVSGHGVAWA